MEQTDGAEVEPLEKLYALLAQCIYRHRESYDKTQLLQVAPHAHAAAVLVLLLLLLHLSTSTPNYYFFFIVFLTGNACRDRRLLLNINT